MHIAFLTPEFPGHKTGHSGGLGTSIFNVAHALIKQGVKVSVFVYGQEEDECYTEDGIVFYRIKNRIFKGLSWYLTHKKVEKIIHTAIKRSGIDLLEVPDWTGFSAWMQIDCPVVMRLHGSDTYFCALDQRPVKPWNRLQEKTAYRQAKAILSVSDFTGAKTNECFGLKREYTVIPNGIATEAFTADAGQQVNEPIVLYFGTLIRKKGALDIPLIFNQVLKQMPEARLILAGGDSGDIRTGSTSTFALMKDMFSEEALGKLSYLGKLPYDQVRGLIEQSAVCIFPSYAEALPVSWLEAMAMGKAIVASNIGWAHEMLEHEKEAFLCSPSAHTQFADYILRCLENEALRIAMGREARERAIRQFDMAVVLSQNMAFYEQVIKGGIN